jgi:hypothetical protein
MPGINTDHPCATQAHTPRPSYPLDDRRVLVSAKFTGTDEATSMLRRLHGNEMRKPLPGYEPRQPAFVRWHREPQHGGVFRQPALARSIAARFRPSCVVRSRFT